MSVSQDFFKEDPLNGVVESADWSPEAQAILMDDVVAHPENRIFQWHYTTRNLLQVYKRSEISLQIAY